MTELIDAYVYIVDALRHELIDCADPRCRLSATDVTIAYDVMHAMLPDTLFETGAVISLRLIFCTALHCNAMQCKAIQG